MTILQHAIAQAAAASGYQIARSLRFNSADSAHLNRTPASAGNRKTWTYSTWFKRSSFNSSSQILLDCSTSGTNVTHLRFVWGTAESLVFYNEVGGTANGAISTTPIYRDTSAFYHVVLAVDTTQATASNRVKLYVNGSQVTALDSASYPTQNADTMVNTTNQHRIGNGIGYLSSNYFNGYMAETRFIDGQQLDATSFGEFDANTGVWVPKAYTGTYGTNGFWLKFDDNSGTTATTLGKDSSGNGNNWTPNNFSVTAGVGNDSLVDSPTNYGTDTGAGGEVRGNYATLNPLQNGGLTLANGNLDATASTSAWRSSTGTLARSTGKFYYEITVTATTATNYMIAGVAKSSVAQSDMNDAPGVLNANSWGIQFGSPSWKVNNGYTALSSSYTYTTNDVLMIAVDVDAGKFWFGKNGTWIESGNPATGANAIFTNLTGEIMPMLGVYASGNTGSVNFGQRPFAYTAPSGFKALCTQNLPTPAVGASASTQAGKYFNPVLWTGDGAATKTVTGVGFQPDFVWLKSRSAAYSHVVYDAVRGFGIQKGMPTNATTAEGSFNDNSTSGYLNAVTSDGYSLTKGSTGEYTNQSGVTYIGWNWKANGAGSSNTAGSITSTVSANTTAGVSVVTYTGNGSAGATVGHGLGVAPRLVFVKSRSNAYNWCVYARAANGGNGQNGGFYLNLTDAWASDVGFWNNTAATSSVLTLGSGFAVNNSGSTYVAYCFAEVAGFSKFGSFTASASADGTFVYTGFRPRYVMIKQTSTTSNWFIHDTARSPYNVAGNLLRANLSDAELSPSTLIDILSNGFKIRDSGFSGDYIYVAFAEAPFQYSRAR